MPYRESGRIEQRKRGFWFAFRQWYLEFWPSLIAVVVLDILTKLAMKYLIGD